MTEVLAFDVNETLLDLRALDPAFDELFGSAALRPLWFGQMLQLGFVGGLTGAYVDFTAAQRAALQMLATREGRTLTVRQIDETVDLMTQLPPHPEVPEALRKLAATPLRMVALTNSVAEVAEQQLRHAGLREFFDDVMSADSVQRLKPSPEPYQAVASACGVPVTQVRLVAAHAWDVTGALQAGCKAAFVARPGMVPSPLGPRPDIVGDDLAEVAELIAARDCP